MSADPEAFIAEWLGEARLDPRRPRIRSSAWNDANDYGNEAHDYDLDREAGE